ncbi:hypothetical protein [Tersicoccus sp. Bi-70]|uniref:hypothetical protein n=1 Tax=Tersicoccus sp. Bi-70 TaxID=1897634 RepID=UPI0009789CCC|nr:hypothetical protein [Tersicoccus sp. Bi-70]OMH37580.1 hypothetical protein BGP79_12225 [Tersicoccus sp. Bi-70]
MAPHLHLSGDTLEQVRETLHTRYGGAARLVSADKVRDGGLGGLLGRWHVEVVAELPEGIAIDDGGASSTATPDDPAAQQRATAERGAAAHELSGRSGLAALLAAADDEEELLRDVAPATGAVAVVPGAAAAPSPAAAPAARAVPTAPRGPVPVAAAGGSGAPATARAAAPLVPELDTPATRGRDFAALLSRLGGEDRATGTAPATAPAGSGALTVAGGIVDPAPVLTAAGRPVVPASGAVTGAPTAPAGARSLDAAGPGLVPGVVLAELSVDEVLPAELPDGAAAAELVAPVAPVTAYAGPPVPSVLGAPGDLVVVLGVGERAVAAARTMAASVGAQLHTAGTAEDPTLPRLQGPRSAIAARAGAVRAGTSAVVGYGLGSPISLGTRSEVTAQLSTAVGLGADQVWLVVDARHKHEDIEPWVRRISSRVPIDALAVIGVAETGSPETVNELGLPVGWVDGGPAVRAFL